MNRAAALGFDVGTTSVKAGLIWLDSNEPMKTVSSRHTTGRPRDGKSEQDPGAWLDGMTSCWQALQHELGPIDLRSVGICAQVNTHLIVDGDLRPLQPAITWQDIRAADEAAELDARVEGLREGLWGGPFRIDASFALSRLLWLQRHEPDATARARWLLQPRDFCVAAMTGSVTSDAISPVGLVGPDEAYIDGVLALVDGASSLMPPIAPLDDAAGRVREANPIGLPADVPVAVGTMDVWGSVFGSGLVKPRRAMQLAGTSEVVAVLSDAVAPTPGIISFPPRDGQHLHAGPTQAGGDALVWAARAFDRSVEEVLGLAADGQRDPRPLVFLPHLAGERAPYWNPDARGVFVGLDTSTELRHMALAVLEGVAFSARMLLAGCEKAARGTATELRLSGGGGASPLWNQVKASAHGRPIDVLATLDSGVLGAAFIGMVAAGLADDLEGIAEQRVSVAATIDPQRAEQDRLEQLYGVYRDAYRALVPVFGALASSEPSTP